MGILLWIGFEIAAGAFAKLLMPGPYAGGIAVAIPLGILGSLVGGFLNNPFQSKTTFGFDFCSLMMAVAGSLFVLFCYRCDAMRGAE